MPEFADKDVYGAIAVGHRVAPDPLIDRLPLKHAALMLGQQLEKLELAPGQIEAGAGDKGLELIGADLELPGDQGADIGRDP